jgi:hypothetical protein
VGAGRAARLNDGWGYARLCQRVPTQERSSFFRRFGRRDPCRRRGNSDALLVDGRQAGPAPRDPDQFKRKGLVSFYQNCSLKISVDVKIRPTIAKAVDASFLARLEVWVTRPPTDAMTNSGNHRRGSLQPQPFHGINAELDPLGRRHRHDSSRAAAAVLREPKQQGRGAGKLAILIEAGC